MSEDLEMGHDDRTDVLYDPEELKENLLDKGLHNIVTVMFTGMVFIVMLQVVVRYFIGGILGISVHWTEELARYLMIVTAYLGTGIAWRNRQNMSISFFTDMLPSKINTILKALTDTLCFLFAVICAYGAYLMSQRMAGSPLGTLAYGTTGTVYLLMSICFVVVAFYTARWMIASGILTKRMISAKLKSSKNMNNS